MTDLSLASVPESEPDQQLALFEGARVNRYRLNPGSIGEFACLDENNEHVELHVGDTVVLQVEAIVVEVSHGTTFKGGVQVKAMDRIHHGKVMDGTQQIVAVRRRGE